MKSTMARWKKMKRHRHDGCVLLINADAGGLEEYGVTLDQEATWLGMARCDDGGSGDGWI